MIILYENKILTSALSCNSENVNFPLSNLKNTKTTKFFRSLSDTGLRIVVNQEALKADWFFLLNHNLTAGATIKLEANTSDAWASPAFSETVTWKSGTISHNFTEQTYSFWSVYIDDPSNPNEFIQIGLTSLGKALSMPGFDPAVKVSYVDTTNRTRTQSLTIYKDIRPVYKIVSVKFPAILQDEWLAIETMLEFYHNTGDPVIMVLWEESLDIESPIYCELPARIEKEKLPVDGVLFSKTLEFEETF